MSVLPSFNWLCFLHVCRYDLFFLKNAHASPAFLQTEFAQAASHLPAGGEDKMVRRIEGIINSMTPGERSKPELIKASRKRRIASGAGVQVQEVNRLLNQFEQMQKMMKQFSKGGMAKLMRGMKGMLPGLR